MTRVPCVDRTNGMTYSCLESEYCMTHHPITPLPFVLLAYLVLGSPPGERSTVRLTIQPCHTGDKVARPHRAPPPSPLSYKNTMCLLLLPITCCSSCSKSGHYLSWPADVNGLPARQSQRERTGGWQAQRRGSRLVWNRHEDEKGRLVDSLGDVIVEQL